MSQQQEPEIIDVGPEREADAAAAGDRSVVLAQDVLPDTLLIVPALERPMFPNMMGTILLGGDELKRSVTESLQSEPKLLGLVMVRSKPDEPRREPEAASDFHEVGVAIRVVQAAPSPAEGPMQLVVQVLQRFNVVEFVSQAPVFRARVAYWHETGFRTNQELKAYSVSVVECIKELVNLNPLYKEGLSLLIDRMDVHDPGVLADFAAAMTTASGEELQEILAMRSIRKRIEHEGAAPAGERAWIPAIKTEDRNMLKRWKCEGCGYIHDGDEAPAECPKCGASADRFALMDDAASDLVERSRRSNALHCHVVDLARQIEWACKDGIDDGLDPGCADVFRKSLARSYEIMKLSMTEMQGHIAKGKWG